MTEQNVEGWKVGRKKLAVVFVSGEAQFLRVKLCGLEQGEKPLVKYAEEYNYYGILYQFSV